VSQYTTHGSEILNIGAGNSRKFFSNSALSEEMYKEGYTNITNTDFSTIVVEDMQLKYKNLGFDETFECNCPTYSDICCDVRDMKNDFEDETFDIVVDKGTLDSVLCGAYSSQNCRKMFREVSRVLKSKGYYICISYGDPDIRKGYFDVPEYEWAIMSPSPYKIFKPNVSQADVEFDDKDKEKNKDYYHYVYVLQKVRNKCNLACLKPFATGLSKTYVEPSDKALSINMISANK
jgi:ubiquinone/menaquinone biosynthesis C-methylase UbiE